MTWYQTKQSTSSVRAYASFLLESSVNGCQQISDRRKEVQQMRNPDVVVSVFLHSSSWSHNNDIMVANLVLLL